LASLVRAGLCLYQGLLPASTAPAEVIPELSGPFHFPRVAQSWAWDRAEGPRRAGVASLSLEGSAMFAVLAEVPGAVSIEAERSEPLGPHPEALFVVTGAGTAGLIQGLRSFREWLAKET